VVALNTTLPPEQNVVAPPAAMDTDGPAVTVTETALEVAAQPETVRLTV
jgi:hypothetical protein